MTYKTCNVCDVEKSLKNFANNKSKKDGRSSTCLICSRERNKKWYLKNKHWKKNKLSNQKKIRNIFIRNVVWSAAEKIGCYFCQENDRVALDFHHLDTSNKDDNISTLLSRCKNYNTIKKELSKCAVVCSNCHRKIHAGKKVIDLDKVKEIILPEREVVLLELSILQRGENHALDREM